MKGIRLKYLAELNPKTNLQTLKSEDMVSFAPMECVKQGYIMPYEKSISDYNSSYNLFRHGDIVLAKVTPCFENGNIAIAAALKNDMGYGSSELFVIRANKCNNVYLFYLLQSNQFRQTAISTMTGAGGLKRVSPDAIRNLIVPIADVNLQQRIADYLDSKTAAIDSLIADKQKLVDLLKEKRNAVISEAVTKGLDKTARMKDSGIDWIGKIPEGWEVLQNRFVLSKTKNIVGDNEKDYPVLSLSMKGVIRKAREDNSGKIPVTYAHYYQIVVDNSLLLCLFDMDVTPCIVGHVNESGIVSPAYSSYIPFNHQKVIIKFYYYWYLRMHQEGLLLALSNNVRSSLNSESFNALYVPVPPKNEQQRIADYLDRKTAEIDSLISDINEQIEKLKEYRQIVISEVVTGKVAV